MNSLIHSYSPNSNIFYHQGLWVTQQQFIDQAHYLATILLDQKSKAIINLCTDRYYFTLVFAASLIADLTMLLPPTPNIGVINKIIVKHNVNLCIIDYSTTDIETRTLDITEAISPDQQLPEQPNPTIDSNQLAAIIFTSGSTGEPKVINKQWRTFWGTANLLQKRFSTQLDGIDIQSHCIVATVPSQHMYGLEMTTLLALQGNVTLHCATPFYPADIAKCLEELNQPCTLVTTPIHLKALIDANIKMSNISSIISATAPLSEELAQQAESLFGATLYEIYGCSEAGSLATRRTILTQDSAEYWSLLDDFEIVEDTQGNHQITGKNLPSTTQLDDNVTLKDNKQFRLHGRKDDIVKVGGKRVSLSEINQIIMGIDEIDDCVVLQLPNKNKLAAVVVSKTHSPRTIAELLVDKIDSNFIPRPIRIVDAIPRNNTGKIVKSNLLNLFKSS